MAQTLTGTNVPGGGAAFATDNTAIGGGRVQFIKLLVGPDGTLQFVDDAAGLRLPVKAVISDTSDAEVKTGDLALNAQRVSIVGGASVAELQIDGSPYTPGTSGGVPAHFFYNDVATDALSEKDVGAARCSKDRLLHMLGAPRVQTVSQSTVMPTSTAETTILAAPGLGIYNDLTFLGIYSSNTSTPVTVSLRDTTGGPIVYRLPLSEKGGSNIVFGKDNWPQTTPASSWTATLSAAVATVFINVLAIKRVS